VTDVVVIGAGIVGAACAYYAARAGLSVAVVDRGPLAGGTSSAGEGNILLSDKHPGPELELALLSNRLWRELDIGPIELEAKGGLMVCATSSALSGLDELMAGQRAVGVDAVRVTDLASYEPLLNPELVGGGFYPQDLQVQPMLATARLLRASRASLHCGQEVVGVEVSGDRVVAVRTAADRLPAGAVVNAGSGPVLSPSLPAWRCRSRRGGGSCW
jgi:glycine/D-amino acid oxidase-like deaminating enzyme